MNNQKLYKMPFSKIYQCYIDKVTRKNVSKDQVDMIIYWMCGYDEKTLSKQIEDNVNLKTFFENAPKLNPKRFKIKGKICGVQIETINDDMMHNIRCLDKMIDNLAKHKNIDDILK